MMGARDVTPVVQGQIKPAARLDLATVEAVLELREALRALDALEHEDISGKSAAVRGTRAHAIVRARTRHLSARSNLELVLLGDE